MADLTESDMKRIFTATVFCLVPLLAKADGWEYSLAPYLWLPTISLDSAKTRNPGGPLDGDRVDIGPTSYLSALNFALMLAGEMRKDDWVVMGDFIYLDFGIDDKNIDFLRPGVGPIAGTYGAGLSGTMITLAGGKTFVRTDNYHADALVGWRRFAMSLDISGDLLGGGTVKLDTDLDFNDAFVGINGVYRFGNGKRWSLRYYGDVGAGESDMTWQAVVGVGYGFGWGDLFVNYRHLVYDFGDVGRFDALSITFSGPSIGVSFQF
jgi:hypothetical protein